MKRPGAWSLSRRLIVSLTLSLGVLWLVAAALASWAAVHETNEVFIPITGKWGIFWQNTDGKKHEVVLEPYDTVSVPVGLSRGFRYLGKGEGLMLAIIGGTDPGRVHWPKETVELAKKHGMVLRDGDLVEIAAAAE